MKDITEEFCYNISMLGQEAIEKMLGIKAGTRITADSN